MLLATDLADHLVLQGLPFRDAHHAVGALVGLAEKLDVPLNKIPEADARKIAPKLGKDWREVFDNAPRAQRPRKTRHARPQASRRANREMESCAEALSNR